MRGAWTVLRGLDRNRRFEAPVFPGAPALIDQSPNALRVHIARDDDRCVFGAIVTIEELLAVVVFIRHCLDVLEETHGRVLIRMYLKRRGAKSFEQLLRRAGAVLVVF